MPTTYPTSKQTFTDPLTTDFLNSPSHAGLHVDKNDTLEAIQDRLGFGSDTTPGATGRVLNSTSATATTWTGTPTFTGLTLSGLTAGSILFAGTGGLISQDNANLFWDDTNNRLGIGTVSPASQLDISSTAPTFRMTDTTASANSLLFSVDANAAELKEISGAANSLLTLDLANNRLGIGIVPTTKIHMSETYTGSTTAYKSFNLVFDPNPSADITATTTFSAFYVSSIINSANTQVLTGLNSRALEFVSRHSGSGTVNVISGMLGETSLGGSGTITSGTGIIATIFIASGATGTITTARGLNAQANLANLASGQTITTSTLGNFGLTAQGAGSTITTLQGINIARPTSSGTIGTTYGIFIANQTSAGGTHTNVPYGLYQAGTGDRNYFGSPVGIGQTAPTALLHIKAGTATANTSPIKLTSGPLLTTPEVGAIEFLTDKKYFTITTGTARKEFTLNDAALTSGRVPFATTNGRLTDDADLTFATDTLTAAKMVGTTSVKVGTAAGFISSDGSTGATGTFTSADAPAKVVTVKDGIITSIV